MVAELVLYFILFTPCCSLAKISMVAELNKMCDTPIQRCSLAKISMVAELVQVSFFTPICCSLAKISMVAER